jgi:alkylation response protein AidB-like acyl-CoA dehydrogenase
MDLTLTEDQLALRSGLRTLLDAVWSADRLREATPITGKEWQEFAEIGVFDLAGTGLGLADAAVLFEELGAALLPGPLVATALAAEMAPADAIVTALDLDAPVLVAEHLDLATHVVTVSSDGLRLLRSDEIAAISAPRPLDPLTPVAAVSGAPGGELVGSAADAAVWRARGAVLTASLQVGVARGALDLAVRYARERTQFDRVIGGFQAVKHLLAESLVRADLARAAVLVAALTLDDPEAGGAAEAVAAAKVLADEAATLNGRCGIQVHGGMGFSWEVLAHLYLKRAWVLETAYADDHLRVLADSL